MKWKKWNEMKKYEMKWIGMKWTNELVWSEKNIFAKTFKPFKIDLKRLFGIYLERSMIAVCSLVYAR